MRKVFLDDLPKKGKNIDWTNSVGCMVRFIYADVVGEIDIDKYDCSSKILKLKE